MSKHNIIAIESPEVERRLSRERRQEPREKIARLEEELSIAKTLLRAVKTGFCWCPIGIGNPMQKQHSPVCKTARELLGEPQE